ncbi:MAG TPA: hypothetical protein VD966_00485, partial [Pyrinomonadaceae bacterium]|nr:hypothetical protein [Pyrinomonadaceae bacterium]
MRVNGKLLISITFILTILLGGMVAVAQDASPEKSPQRVEREVIIERNGIVVSTPGLREHPPLPPVPPDVIFSRTGEAFTFSFVSSEMSFDRKVVKGAPYSAEAVTETVQTLSDGNRIVRKTSATVYRDSEGRTRRDQTLGSIGPFAAAGDPPQTFFINDPVAGVNYILDPRSRTARKLTIPRLEGKPGERVFERAIAPPPPGASGSRVMVLEDSGPEEERIHAAA